MLSWQSSLQCCVNCNCSISLNLLSHVIVKQRMSCKEYRVSVTNFKCCQLFKLLSLEIQYILCKDHENVKFTCSESGIDHCEYWNLHFNIYSSRYVDIDTYTWYIFFGSDRQELSNSQCLSFDFRMTQRTLSKHSESTQSNQRPLRRHSEGNQREREQLSEPIILRLVDYLIELLIIWLD